MTLNHYQNKGHLTMSANNGLIHYNQSNIAFRGTKVIDGEAFGIVIETGNDCQVYRIHHNTKKTTSGLQKTILDVCLHNLYLMLLMVSFTSVIIYSKQVDLLWPIIRKMIILFNTMIPLSLQFFFTAGSGVLSQTAHNHQATINRSGLMAFKSILFTL